MSCRACGTRTSLWCLGCERVQYCGRACQFGDWKRHQPSCFNRGLIGAGVYEEGYIPVYPEAEFWRSLEGKTLDDVLERLQGRPDIEISQIVTRLLRAENWVRVFALFNVQHSQAQTRITTFVCAYGGTQSIAALDVFGIEFNVLDLEVAIHYDNKDVVQYLINLPNVLGHRGFGMLLIDAVGDNSLATLALLLRDPRADGRDITDTFDFMWDETSPAIIKLLINDARVDVKKAVEFQLKRDNITVARAILDNLETPARLPRPFINAWLRRLDLSDDMREVLNEYKTRE